MKFKVGQRVRCLDGAASRGKEATILEVLHDCYRQQGGKIVDGPVTAYWLDIDGIGNGLPAVRYAALASEIAPLTPPAADEWAASKVRDLFKPQYIEPERVKVDELTLDEFRLFVRKHLENL